MYCPMSNLCQGCQKSCPWKGKDPFTMIVGLHQGSTRPQVGPCSSAPGRAQGMCRQQCHRKYLASLLDCTHCSDRSPKSSPSGSHRGAHCSVSGPGAQCPADGSAEGPRAAAGSSLGPLPSSCSPAHPGRCACLPHGGVP